jgi:serine/threonine-protein phosphatase 6 regulatory ankyrin repeat subunit B
VNNTSYIIAETKSNINEVNLKGETALHLAAKNNSMGCVLMIEILIGTGANLNARNKWGQTPLQFGISG